MSRGAPNRIGPPPVIRGKAAIFRAIPPGSRRCRSQREWLRAALAEIEAAGFYTNRAAHYAAIARRLMRFMDWGDRTARPGHGRLRCLRCAASGRDPDEPGKPCRACGGRPLSADTVGRAVAWLQERGLLGLVSPGTTAMLRPGVLYAGTGNVAAIYVLCVKRKPQIRSPVAGQDTSADLTGFRRKPVKALRAHEVNPKVKPSKARATRGQPVLPRSTNALHTPPQTRSEGLAAAQAVQERSRHLRVLSPEHIRHLARPFFLSGWNGLDVLAAIDRPPRGRPYGYRHAPHSPARWAARRLLAWIGPDGLPLPSPSQMAAEAHRRDVEEQERRRAGRRPPIGYTAGAALARQLMAQRLAGRTWASQPTTPPTGGLEEGNAGPGRAAQPWSRHRAQ